MIDFTLDGSRLDLALRNYRAVCESRNAHGLCNNGCGPWVCSIPRGHAGPHVALGVEDGAGAPVFAVWDHDEGRENPW